MVSRIYLTSAEGRTGKSTVAVGLLHSLTATSGRVGVFRPIVRSGKERDYLLELLLAHASGGQRYQESVGVDYATLHKNSESALQLIVERAALAEKNLDTVLILGSDYTDVGTPTELATNARIAANLAAPVILVVGGRSEGSSGFRNAQECADVALIAIAELRSAHAEPLAIVVNRADPANVTEIATKMRELSGLPAWAIPEDVELTAPLLHTVLAATEAELLWGEKTDLTRPVRGVTMAAMSLANVLTHLVPGGMVVVPGDRPDVLVGVLAAQISGNFPTLAGVILNGDFPLDPEIIRLVEGLDLSLPIAKSKDDSYHTVQKIAAARSRLAADSAEKYARALALFAENVDADALTNKLPPTTIEVLTPLRFEHSLVQRARSLSAHIVLPEGDDDRILQAGAIARRRGIARITLLGQEADIRRRAAALGVDLGDITIINPEDSPLRARFAEEYASLRAHRGVSLSRAGEIVGDVSTFGTLLVHAQLADGMVSGARHTTAHTIRPAFEIIKTAPGVQAVSSVFLMALADRVLVYGDCAIIPHPSVEQLADIAISSAHTAKQFGIEARVAMLSYSTGESGKGEEVERVREATALVRERYPLLPVTGPIQYDAAADPEVGKAKMPGDAVAGHATVFVFPDLNTGNNTYKAVQRSSGAVAIGPVLQGLAKPINDLSRGADVRDIVNTIAITAIQARSE